MKRRGLAIGLVSLIGLNLVTGVSVGVHRAAAAPPRAAQDLNLTQYVNPFNGTDAGQPDFGTGGGAANTFPGATFPFGMMQWSPDTSPSRVNFAGGYSYGDTAIKGFSLTHMSGAGCAIYQDIPFMPIVGAVTSSPAVPLSTGSAYTTTFSHANEQATPGYYGVGLDSGVKVDLTTTTRTGIGRFTYPATATASMLVNTGGSAMPESATAVAIDPANREVSGSASSGAFCFQHDTYTVYFAAQFSQPFSGYGTWKRQLLLPGTTSNSDTSAVAQSFGNPPQSNPANGAQAGAYVSFDTTHDQAVEVRVGISFVSVQNARDNLQRENSGLSFDTARANAGAAWNSLLNRAQVQGGSLADTRTIYSMLYHVLLQPTVFSDANGQYMGFDNQVHTAQGYTQYANYSGWDIYRSQIPLLAMIAPQQTGDMVQSLITDAAESGYLPKWSVANGHTNTMVGDPADPIIAGAYAFGATHFDTASALRAMVKGATQVGTNANASYVERPGGAEYAQLGYVPQEEDMGPMASYENPAFVWAAASTTMEYATADFSIAQLAATLGDTSTYGAFMPRSDNWRTLYNPASGYIQPRQADGAFASAFDPTSQTGFAEGDAAQYTLMVPYNLHGLFDALGGTAAARARLDTFFTQLNDGPDSLHAFLGNEPTLETPWEYDFVGEPWQTQGIVRKAILGLYNAAPGGYPGNDDLGEMSSWYVLGALGLYPEIPAIGVLVLGSPLFPHITLHLAGGAVTISAPNASDTTPYVQGLTLNGQSYDKPWLSFGDLAHGATLAFDLGSAPNITWGSDPANAPPSFPPHALSSITPTATVTTGAATAQATPTGTGTTQTTPTETGTTVPLPTSPTSLSTAPNPSATPIPPAMTPTLPAATSVPLASTPTLPASASIPPSATAVPPAATSIPPSATSIPPTATAVPPSATPVPPMSTSVPLASTPTPPSATLVRSTPTGVASPASVATVTVAAPVEATTTPTGPGVAGPTRRPLPPGSAPKHGGGAQRSATGCAISSLFLYGGAAARHPRPVAVAEGLRATRQAARTTPLVVSRTPLFFDDGRGATLSSRTTYLALSCGSHELELRGTVRAGGLRRGTGRLNLHGDAFDLLVRPARARGGRLTYTWRLRIPAAHYDSTFTRLPGTVRRAS